jgi:hypothetical protein
MAKTTKHAGGRPRKWKSPKLMQDRIDEYFGNIAQNEDLRPSMTGLALALGFLERDSLWNYAGYSEEFFGIIKTARLRIEHHYEQALQTTSRVAGPIFALKQLGWKDTKEVDANVTGNLTVSDLVLRFTDESSG